MNNKEALLNEMKQIAEKIAELEAKKMACQLSGDLDGAWSAHQGINFAKKYFADKDRKYKRLSKKRS